ncbi:MAG: RluA family pseudouridine synthase [Vicinamibacteria bacterium]|nr:RluA family pseudouridine synthase [Vicinamibacteria bacterium]
MPSARPKPSDTSLGERRGLIATASHAGLRVDKALAEVFPDLSRSRIHGLLGLGAILVNGRPPKPSAKLREGDRIAVEIPPAVPSDLVPESGDLDIVYEDESLLVVSKPAGVVVHPGAGVVTGTLAAALLAHCGALSRIGGVTRPGIVHRLDKGTSGLLVVAKNDEAHRSLSAQFKGRTITKIYAAICLGTPRPARGSVLLPIGRDPRHRQRMAVVTAGRAAHTDYEVTEVLGPASVLRLTLHTGRTHQIRVHMAALKCPLVGDQTYGAAALAAKAQEPCRHALTSFPRPALHAEVLGFTHPVSGKPMRFEAPWPEDLQRLRASLKEAIPGSRGGSPS